MTEVGKAIVDELGALIAIAGCSEDPLVGTNEFYAFEEYELVFECGGVCVTAEDEWSTLRVTQNLSTLPNKIELSKIDPWRKVLGSPVKWTWSLFNHWGLMDGYQMEFETPDGLVDIQWICVAPYLEIGVFRRIDI